MKRKKITKKTKLFQWQLDSNNHKCVKCERPNSTVDHIIPLFIIDGLCLDSDVFLNDEDNFQYLCRLCNMKKSNGLEPDNPKTYTLMIKYLAMAKIKWLIS